MIETIESPHINVATSKNFKTLVLENSRNGAVLVNFWSKESEPCLQQYSILDKLIHNYGGRVLLINVDVDAEVLVTKKYGVTSVPTLKLFRNEKAVETMHGFQSEDEIKQALDNYIARDSDIALARAIQAYAKGEHDAAYQLITEAIVFDPVNPRLPLAMCKLLKHEQRYFEAQSLLDSLPGDIRINDDIVQFENLLSFYNETETFSDFNALEARVKENSNDLEARRYQVAHYMVLQKYESALQELVSIMDINYGYHGNYAQKTMLRVFNVIGNDDPLVAKYRANLQRYIH